MAVLVHDVRGSEIVILEDVTEGETYVTLSYDVDGNPLEVVTADGDLFLKGSIHTHEEEVFGGIDEPIS